MSNTDVDLNRNQTEKTAQELRLLYQDALDNIRFAKRQQWLVAYYLILIFAALLTAHDRLADDHTLRWSWKTGQEVKVYSTD